MDDMRRHKWGLHQDDGNLAEHGEMDKIRIVLVELRKGCYKRVSISAWPSRVVLNFKALLANLVGIEKRVRNISDRLARTIYSRNTNNKTQWTSIWMLVYNLSKLLLFVV